MDRNDADGRVTLSHIIAAEPARHPNPALAVNGTGGDRIEQAASVLLGVLRVIVAGGKWTDHLSSARLGMEIARLFEAISHDKSIRLEVMKFFYGFAANLRSFDEKRLSNRVEGDQLIVLLDGMVKGCEELLGPLDACLMRNRITTN